MEARAPNPDGRHKLVKHKQNEYRGGKMDGAASRKKVIRRPRSLSTPPIFFPGVDAARIRADVPAVFVLHRRNQDA